MSTFKVLKMGRLRSKSFSRFEVPHAERETLLPCPRCNGACKVSNFNKRCNWCLGLGGVIRLVFKAWARWERIVRVHKSKCNSCPPKGLCNINPNIILPPAQSGTRKKADSTYQELLIALEKAAVGDNE